MAISNQLNKYISDVIPHTSRVTELRMEGAAPISLLTIYAPQSGRPAEEKEKFYQELTKNIKNIPNNMTIPTARGLECQTPGRKKNNGWGDTHWTREQVPHGPKPKE